MLHNYKQCDESNRLDPLSTRASYEHKLPDMNEQESQCVCSGFIREGTVHYVPFEIIVLCALFLYNKSNDHVLRLLQSDTREEFCLESPEIELDAFKWKLCVSQAHDDAEWSLYSLSSIQTVVLLRLRVPEWCLS